MAQETHYRRQEGPLRKKRKFELGRPPANTKVRVCECVGLTLVRVADNDSTGVYTVCMLCHVVSRERERERLRGCVCVCV